MNNAMSIMSVDDFVNLTQKEPLKWINYCEILLDKIGRVIICQGSHATTAINYAAKVNNVSPKEMAYEIRETQCDPLEWIIDKYGIIAIWYNGYIHGARINRFQKRSINILKKNKLICNDERFMYIRESNEYRNYLYRESLYVTKQNESVMTKEENFTKRTPEICFEILNQAGQSLEIEFVNNMYR